MPTGTLAQIAVESVGDLLERLGEVPPRRVRLHPAPGTATEQDLVEIYDREKRRYELVDSALVEKIMGIKESLLATWIAHLLWQFLEEHNLGLVGGEAGPTRLKSGLVRIPDVSFFSWERLLSDEMPDVAILDLAPDLAVEVVSKSNTRKELKRKVGEYFEAGVRLVWLVYPNTQTVEVYTSQTRFRRLSKPQTLDGNTVLPGFSVSLKKLFTGMARVRKGR